MIYWRQQIISGLQNALDILDLRIWQTVWTVHRLCL